MNKQKYFIVDESLYDNRGIKVLLQNEKGLEWMGHAMNANILHGIPAKPINQISPSYWT